MPKITIVGSGDVGTQVAFYAALKELGNIVLIDIVEGLPQGKALDLWEGMPIVGSNIKVTGSNGYGESKDSDIVIVTAGFPRKPGMSRDDLLKANGKIIKSIIPEVIKYSPNCILIVVTNPLDAMVQLAYNLSHFPKKRVIGMAGVLDSVRFKSFLAQELKADVNEVEAIVLGGHGDLMVPLVGHCKVAGRPITELLLGGRIDAIVERVRNGGAEIIGLLKTGSTVFAPALSIVEMVESILMDLKKILPCSVLLEGEYGVEGIFIGVPVRLGKEGIEEIIQLKLNNQEKTAFQKSVDHIKELIKVI